MVLRIFKMIATSGFLTALECTKVVLGRGSAPDPARGAYSALPDTLACLRAYFYGRGNGEKGEGEKKGRDRPPYANFWMRPCLQSKY